MPHAPLPIYLSANRLLLLLFSGLVINRRPAAIFGIALLIDRYIDAGPAEL
jgi:hypothetical protein